ncbi:MAG: phospholipid carrier-dependent glycosyltransferase, partial [Leptolyngbya sp. SIO1D8]|nr:phospholipid carrier-dependent glycosyltransferase [Leptolyngbya sp. SIO1D8]
MNHKVFWNDEAYTAMRASGYLISEVEQEAFQGQITSQHEFQHYLRPAADKTLADTIRSLKLEDAQHPPLYYVLTHFWVRWFGASVSVIRSLSVIISLFVLPCFYWLCRELFKSSLAALFGTMLVAVSPIHVLYSQEARQYGLWTALTLLSSA